MNASPAIHGLAIGTQPRRTTMAVGETGVSSPSLETEDANMMGVLLESRAKHQRRSGGAAASVVAHAAIITAVVVGTAHGTMAPRTIEKPKVVMVTPPTPATVVHERTTSVPSAPRLPSNVVIRNVDVPKIIPKGLPPIDFTRGLASDSIVIGRPGDAGSGKGATIIDGGGENISGAWTVNDILMNVITPAKPRYPESLRSAGIDGRVLVQFVVDTTGRVDMSSVKILSSTHDLFSRAVREALGNFRFRAAVSAGRRIPALAQMPFEFQLKK